MLFGRPIRKPTQEAEEKTLLGGWRSLLKKGKIVDPNEAKTLPTDDVRPWERYFLAYDPAPTLARLT